MSRTTFHIFTDFNQFIACDSTADWDDLYEKWTEEAIDRMSVTGDGYIAIGTARAMYAPVTVAMNDNVDNRRPDRSVRLPLAVPSGELVISGVTDGGISGGTVLVMPGMYEVTVDYFGLDTVDDTGLNGDDEYVLTLERST